MIESLVAQLSAFYLSFVLLIFSSSLAVLNLLLSILSSFCVCLGALALPLAFGI